MNPQDTEQLPYFIKTLQQELLEEGKLEVVWYITFTIFIFQSEYRCSWYKHLNVCVRSKCAWSALQGKHQHRKESRWQFINCWTSYLSNMQPVNTYPLFIFLNYLIIAKRFPHSTVVFRFSRRNLLKINRGIVHCACGLLIDTEVRSSNSKCFVHMHSLYLVLSACRQWQELSLVTSDLFILLTSIIFHFNLTCYYIYSKMVFQLHTSRTN